MYKLKVLAVDDDPDILELIEATLEDEYEVMKASSGEEALSKVKESSPDVIILDYMLPDIEGPKICEKLREDPLFIHIPILMLTGKGETEDKVRGLDAGADDYMVKPFSPDELSARIRMLIRRSSINLDANPLTRLPGNVTITGELGKRIKSKEKFAVLYLDIDNFKALNDYYGFERGDEVIKSLGRILLEVIRKWGGTNDFVGHIGGDDFVVLTSPHRAEKIAQEIIAEFEKVSPNFFDEKERLQGFIETIDRMGNKRKFGFLTISIGIITNLHQEFNHVAEVSAKGAELKEFAKKIPQSKYIFDRRSS
ncbi:MAG: diguanylate cyclase response regulator [Candidatus Omnitrophota bacterium]|nr:MAG: diguanylate cyclase response regulator [Candidatus Omnitrophota bacterium]RKY45495.1 MAG: diguanylate cyclase response regulator [Candidatus Omnitrophota bacterium]HDN86155.1 response regulator [Candidatus Omnitrophota bacterium]